MADLVCSPNAATAFDFLVGRGLRDFQAAAVVGNLQQESRLEPRLEAMDTNNKMSRGIAMWQPQRWQNLLAFASSRGGDPWSLDTQLDFLWYELQSQPGLGLQQLLSTTTIEDATIVFQNRFENPNQALAAPQKRIAYAQGALYACPGIRPPARRGGFAIAAAGVLALVGAVGYGVYKIASTREHEPEIGPEPPPVFRPSYGAQWKR